MIEVRFMTKLILSVIFSVFTLKADASINPLFGPGNDFFERYKELLVDIRTQRLTPEAAKAEFQDIMRLLRENFPNHIPETEIDNIVFPLVGSNLNAVGGYGRGFYVRNFNLFDYSVNGSHPAHDIFIYDPNQDCIDDRKNEFIDIVSVGHGVVLATEKAWSDTSSYRGGNYVWVYDFERGGLWYYAHHRKVVVEPGDIVKPGDKLGEVGRTGFNAKQPRSDTHLHLMYLALDEEFTPVPKNFYSWLQNAKTISKSNSADQDEFRIFKAGSYEFLKAITFDEIYSSRKIKAFKPLKMKKV
jgi:hypothetical protein